MMIEAPSNNIYEQSIFRHNETIGSLEYLKRYDFDKIRTKKSWETMMIQANCGFEDLFGLTNYQKALKQKSRELNLDIGTEEVMNKVYLASINYSYNLSVANPMMSLERLDEEAYLLGTMLLEESQNREKIGFEQDNLPSRFFSQEQVKAAKAIIKAFEDDITVNIGDPFEWLAIHRNRPSTFTVDYALQNGYYIQETARPGLLQAFAQDVEVEVLGNVDRESQSFRLKTLIEFNYLGLYPKSEQVLRNIGQWLQFFQPGEQGDDDYEAWQDQIEWLKNLVEMGKGKIDAEAVRKLSQIRETVGDFYLDAVSNENKIKIEETIIAFDEILERSREVLSIENQEALKRLVPLMEEAERVALKFHGVDVMDQELWELRNIVSKVRKYPDGYFDSVADYQGGAATLEVFSHDGGVIVRTIALFRKIIESLNLPDDYLPELDSLRQAIFEHYNDPSFEDYIDKKLQEYEQLLNAIITDKDVQDLNQKWQKLAAVAKEVKRNMLQTRRGVDTFTNDKSGRNRYADQLLSSITHVSEQIDQQVEVLGALEESGQESLINNFTALVDLHSRMLKSPNPDDDNNYGRDLYLSNWEEFYSKHPIEGIESDTSPENVVESKKRAYMWNLLQFHQNSRINNFLDFADAKLAHKIQAERISQLTQLLGIRQKAERARVKHEVFPYTSLESGSVDNLIASWSVTAHALHRMNKEEVEDLFREIDRVLKPEGRATLFPMDYSKSGQKWSIKDIGAIIRRYNESKGDNEAKLEYAFIRAEGEYRPHTVLIVSKPQVIQD